MLANILNINCNVYYRSEKMNEKLKDKLLRIGTIPLYWIIYIYLYTFPYLICNLSFLMFFNVASYYLRHFIVIYFYVFGKIKLVGASAEFTYRYIWANSLKKNFNILHVCYMCSTTYIILANLRGKPHQLIAIILFI